MGKRRLDERHAVFLNEYVQTWDRIQSYQVAYPGTSEESARRASHRLLTRVDVSTALKERITEQAMAADEVLGRLALHARAGASHFIEVPEPTEGRPSPEPYLNLHKAKRLRKLDAIKKIKQTARTTNDGEIIRTLEVELYDAQNALQILGKNLGLFADQLRIVKALEEALDLLAQELPPDEYERVLLALAKLRGFSLPPPVSSTGEDDEDGTALAS